MKETRKQLKNKQNKQTNKQDQTIH